jgi:hypothetical protein
LSRIGSFTPEVLLTKESTSSSWDKSTNLQLGSRTQSDDVKKDEVTDFISSLLQNKTEDDLFRVVEDLNER